EVRDVVSEAAVAGVPHPLGIARPESSPTLAARNQPVDALEVELIHRAEERLGTDEADGRGNLPQEIGAPGVLVRLDGNPCPDMRWPLQAIGHPSKALGSLG